MLKLPAGQTISKIRWFAVWCRKFRVSVCIDLDHGASVRPFLAALVFSGGLSTSGVPKAPAGVAQANFGDLIIPRNLEVPKPAVLKALPTWDHGVSSGRVSLVDAQTFLVPDFKYDGLGPGERRP